MKLEFFKRPAPEQALIPKQLADFRCELVALDLERTFWEKATILHAEHHREPAKPMRDRFSRHYSDMAALARHGAVERALARAGFAAASGGLEEPVLRGELGAV